MKYISIFISIFILSSIFFLINISTIKLTSLRTNIFSCLQKSWGIVIMIFSLLFFILFQLLFNFSNEIIQPINLILISSGFISIIGFLDDQYNLSPFLRFYLMFLPSTILWINNISIQSINLALSTKNGIFFNLSSSGSFLITCFWLISIVNIINWIDGIDGLAAIQVLIISIAFLTRASLVNIEHMIILSVIICSICISFLPFNIFFKPNVILGDSGSYFLGFLLGSLYLLPIEGNDSYFNFYSPVVLFIEPIIDAFQVIIGRLLNRRSVFLGDRSHLHYKLGKFGLTNYLICFILSLITLVGVVINFYSLSIENSIMMMFILFFAYALFSTYTILLFKTIFYNKINI